QIRRARADGRDTHTWHARQVANRSCHEASRGFVCRQHESDVALPKRFDEWQYRPTRNTEHPADTGVRQPSHEKFRTMHVQPIVPPSLEPLTLTELFHARPRNDL